MRRPVAVITAVAVTLTLLGLSRHLLLATETEQATFTASADYTLAVPAISLGDGWQTTLQIQNTGALPTSARIEFFGAAHAECPATREPLAVQCVGPIPAGAVQIFDVGSDPTLAEARSAIVHSTQPGDAGCSAASGEPLAVLVQRTRANNGKQFVGTSHAGGGGRETLPNRGGGGRETLPNRGSEEPAIASSAYVGVAPAVAGFWDRDLRAYVTVIPWVETSDTRRTILHVQNIGLKCSGEVELEFISGSSCLPRQETLPAIPPGHSIRVDVADEVAGGTSGSAWIRSSQPVAVVVDRWPDNGTMLSTHATSRAAAHQTVDVPLVRQDSNRWNTATRSQNASTRFTALVGMTYRTTEITPTLESQSVVCPGGSVSIDTATVEGLTLPFTGTVALRSLALGPEQPEIPSLTADVDLLSTGGGAAYHAPNRITGTLTAPDIALPWLTRAYHPLTASPGLTYTSQIAVVNQGEAGEGFISLTFYDPDGSITTFQPETPLGPRAMRLIDLADVAALPAGWHGSAVLQFLSLDPGAGVAAAVLETAPGASGDAVTGYAGIVTAVQAQPTPFPSPTATVTPTPTVTPQPTATPATTQPALSNTYLPLLHR
ncbi:MAG: hypothetical protein ACE5F6_17860 [Anaerolineae bacterium]